MSNPWRICEWTDENNSVVRELAFHESETEEVLNLPMPPGAVVREPIMELTHFARAKRYRFFRRKHQPFRVGDTFTENINQGDRDCLVVSIDEDSGHILYNYYMPAGKLFHRDDSRAGGRPISQNHPPKRWREYFEVNQ